MDRTQAETLATVLRDANAAGIEVLDPAVVETFHPWARGKPVLGAFRHVRDSDALNLLVIDWKNRGDDYYLVVFGNPTAAPLLEAHKVRDRILEWRYTPRSRDGRNEERRERFIKSFGSNEIKLPLPDSSSAVSALLEEIWRVVTTRRAAEDIPEAAVDAASASTRAWIFQANPQYYDLAGALARLTEHHWLINQHADKIKAGDTVFLWQSGKDGGVMAYGRILSSPALLPPSEAERPFVRDASALPAKPALRVRLRIDDVLDEPLDRDTLREDPRLVGLMFLRASQGTNFPVAADECAALLDLAAGVRAPRVVKIAPGESARLWDECLADGCICVGWDDVGDLNRYSDKASFRDAFRTHYPYNGAEGTVTKKANELWTLRELKPGDKVVANRGTTEVVAIGTVVESGYRWRPDRTEYKHTVAVDWDTSMARSIPKQSYWANVTVAEVPTELYRAIVLGRDSARQTARDESVTFTDLCDAMQEAGLSYSREVMSAYLLALQTKRFVILTGISGTGKSKLALTVARVLGTGARSKEVTQIPAGAFEFTVHPYSLQHHRLVLPKAMLAALRVPENVRQGGSGEIEVQWPEGRRRLALSPAGKNAVMVGFSGTFRTWFESKLSTGDAFYIELHEAGEDAPHQLRFGIPRKVVREVEEAPRYTAVAVRPDWTDNRGLLGYYNPILQEYVTTDFLRLLLRAADEEISAKREGRMPEPYFVILDEMNLARVEQYFSDFLSALESGEPIELHHDDDVETGEKSDDVPVPKQLRIPSNVYFTGTVNVDETTHMFSPKVLDRSFVMELNLVDLEGFAATGVAGEQSDHDGLQLTGLPAPLHTERPPGIEDWQQLGAMLEGSLRRAVVDMHRLLEKHNRHFGYRVANEIGRFVALADEQCADVGDEARMLWTALDLAVLFKVLPKLHGTQQELEELLASLFAFATVRNTDSGKEARTLDQGWMLDGDTLNPAPDSGNQPAVLPRTAAKLYRMIKQLERRGFTSFIE